MFKRIKRHKLNAKDDSHRRSLIRGMIFELARTGKLKTTPAKAKILKAEFDKLVTKAKRGSELNKREVESFFNNNERITKRFFKVVDEKLSDRNSGYTRVIKTLPRKGDNAPQAYIMLVNFEETKKKSEVDKLIDKKKVTKKKTGVASKIKKALNKNT